MAVGLYRETGATQLGEGHDTAGCALDTAGEAATWCAPARAGGAATRPATLPGVHCDTVGRVLGHDRARPMTRRSVCVALAKRGCTVHSTQL